MQAGNQMAGFSLIEVVVAVLILGVALTGLVEGLTTALASNKESELQTFAALFAAGRIEQIRAEGGLRDGENEGDCGQALPLYRWKQSISAAGVDGLHDVSFAVEHAQTGKTIYELKTLLFEPLEDSTVNESGNRKDSKTRRSPRQ